MVVVMMMVMMVAPPVAMVVVMVAEEAVMMVVMMVMVPTRELHVGADIGVMFCTNSACRIRRLQKGQRVGDRLEQFRVRFCVGEPLGIRSDDCRLSDVHARQPGHSADNSCDLLVHICAPPRVGHVCMAM